MKWFRMKPTVTDSDRARSKKAQQDLELRKERGNAIETEISGIIRRNHFAEKFHEALGGGK